jgi:hypothetical protein
VTGLRLRDDAYYVPTDDGIWILTTAGQVVMTGRSIFQWVDRLAPYLNGRHTLAELTAALPADRKHMAERVINALCERGVVVQTGEDAGPARPLTADEQRLYGHEIGFLGYFCSSGVRRASRRIATAWSCWPARASCSPRPRRRRCARGQACSASRSPMNARPTDAS